jgi:hypothetical protein
VIKRLLKPGSSWAGEEKIVSSGIGSGLKKTVYEIEQDKLWTDET